MTTCVGAGESDATIVLSGAPACTILMSSLGRAVLATGRTAPRRMPGRPSPPAGLRGPRSCVIVTVGLVAGPPDGPPKLDRPHPPSRLAALMAAPETARPVDDVRHLSALLRLVHRPPPQDLRSCGYAQDICRHKGRARLGSWLTSTVSQGVQSPLFSSKSACARRDTTVRPDDRPTPAKIIGELLTNHPEAASLLAEACHCRALAVCSAVVTRLKFAAAQAARLAYEELRHRLEPRRRHPVHFGVGSLLLLVLSAGLAMLVLIELSGLLGGLGSVPPALAATAVWVTVAWLAAVAVRQRRWALVAAIVGAAILLGLLLVALHGFGPHPGWPTASGTPAGARSSALSPALSSSCSPLAPPCSLLTWNRPACSWPGDTGTGPGPPTRRRLRRSRPMSRPPRSPRRPGSVWSGAG